MSTEWTTLQRELKSRASRAGLPPAEAFWVDFKARASLVNQEASSPRQAQHPFLWASLATAAAAALLLLVLWPNPAAAETTRVTSLEVGPPHTGAMILNVVSENGRESGAIVWISGLEEPRD